MKHIKTSAALSFALLAATFSITSSANAQNTAAWMKRTYITINQPIQVPGGVVLQPGKYLMEVTDSASDRNVVQFWNARENHIFATVQAINNYRMVPTGKTAITFYEMPAGQPEAIRAWFYPGDTFGQEFIYHKHFAQAQEVAQATTTQTEQTPIAEAPAEAPLPAPAAVEPAPAPAPPSEVAQNEPAPAPVEQAPQTLPQTASDVPLFALIGFLSLGAALGLRSYSKRTN